MSEMKRNTVQPILALAAAVGLLLPAATTFAQPGAGRGGMRSPETIFQKLDANQDGKLTQEELPERAAEKLLKADADGDGAVTKEELEQAWAARGAGAGGPGGGQSLDELFAAFDKNGDGALSQDEVPERFADKIAAADANGDGQVTKEELEQARAARGGGEGGPPSLDKLFERLDANLDGKLTRDELTEQLAEKLMQADADGDAAVTKEELEAARQKMGGQGAGKLFERFDANGDGKLTKDELPERFAERLMQADADGDGALTKEELEAARERMGAKFVDKMFERFDANADGKLTKEEVPERFAERVMQADADGDGAVTKEELQAAREKLGPRPGATVLFRHFDRDGDGKLVASEVPAMAQERLLKADANGDGGVTLEEIRAAICARPA